MYEARTIDLDMLFYEDEVIDTVNLKVPHPELQKRKFVLRPLNDIASKFKHPVLRKNGFRIIGNLRRFKSDIEQLKIWLKNPTKQFNFSNQNYIAIEGNIGAGKTSLSHKIAKILMQN